MGFFSRKKKTQAKVMVVGLDGVPCSLLKTFINKGITPNIKRIIGDKLPLHMSVVYPEISAVSWPSFMTGRDPGGHGIFGFTDLLPNSYDMYFPNYTNLDAPTIWDRLGEMGKKSIVINQPSTYPAKKIEGALISGFVAVDIFKSVQPSKYMGQLKRMNYKVDIETDKARQDADFLFKELDKALKNREKALEIIKKKEDSWDYIELVVTGTDRLQHYQMDAIMDEKHERHQQAMDYYSKVDALIGRLYDGFCKETGTDGENFIMLSDHGFTEIRQEVYINSWLEENGYLSFEEDERTLANISPDSKAFSLDPGRIFIHREGRFPKGCVAEQFADSLRDEIQQKLKSLTFDGDPVIKDVFTPDQIYNGKHIGKAADLIAWAHYGFDLKSATTKGEIFRKTDLTGMHTQDDAFLWAGGDFADGVHITELADFIVGKFK